MATIEDSVAALTTATTNLTTAVGVQQTSITGALAQFNAAFTRLANLNNVENTADLNKVLSNATIAALALRQLKLVDVGTGKNFGKVNGFSLLDGIDLVVQRSPTSINKVTYDNRGTLRTIPATSDDSTIIDGVGLFQWVNTTVEPDDDETCFTTNTGVLALDGVTPVVGQWLVQAPSWDLIYAFLSHEAQITEDWREDEPTRFATYLATYLSK